jgi:hypothetical protein
MVLNICGQLFLLCPFGSSAPLHFEHLCSRHANLKLLEFRWSELPHAFASWIAFARGMAGFTACKYCTLGTDTSLFSGDAQVARTTYSISRRLKPQFCAIQIRS